MLQSRKFLHRMLVFEFPQLLSRHFPHPVRPMPFLHRNEHAGNRAFSVSDDGGKVSDIARARFLRLDLPSSLTG